MEDNKRHWTEESPDALAHRLAFDFIAQVENRLDTLALSQTDLAKKLNVSEGAVSKLLNNPQNLTIRTIAKYSRALGINAAIVTYEEGDAHVSPINPSVFTACWKRLGKPHDMWDVEWMVVQHSSTHVYVNVEINLTLRGHFPSWIDQPIQFGWSSFENTGNTAAHLWGDRNAFTSLHKCLK